MAAADDDNPDPARTPSRLREWVTLILMTGLVFFGIRWFLFEPFRIPSESMLPTLEVGDMVVVSKFSYGYSDFSIDIDLPLMPDSRLLGAKPRRGDIAVFRHPRDDKNLIKRIIGLPGDTVAKPGGSGGFDGDDFYIIDPNESGDAQALLLEQTVWGRLVDIYDTVPDDVDPDLFTSRLIFADFLIGPDVGVDTAVDDPRWVLSTNQVTGQEILRIKAQIDGTDSDFEQFLGEATASLVEIDPASLAANESARC